MDIVPQRAYDKEGIGFYQSQEYSLV